MIESLLFAWAMVAGVPWPMVGAVAAAWAMPWPALAVTAVLVSVSLRSRPGSSDGEAAVMVGIASELRAGQSLRGAIVAAAGGEALAPVRRLALAGVAMPEVAELMADRLGGDGWMTRSVLTVADRTGGSTAAAFEQLAADALARLVQGELSGMGGVEAMVVAIGAAMVTCGSALVAWMVWKAAQ